jgi:nucleoside-diphosphate-sugar epimerase
MRALVTGGNGFVGSWLTRALLERGDEVKCLVRDGSDTSLLKGVEHTIVTGDVTEPETLPSALEGVDVCYHLAGIRRGTSRDAFVVVNTEGTRHVADAMVKTGARRLVFCSSLAAAGPATLGRPRTEADPCAPEEWYGESKLLGEQLAFTYAPKLEVTSIRPGRIIGPGDHENLMFFKLVKKGMVLRILGPERLYSMVDVDDVVAQFLLQGTKPEAVGEAFFAANEEYTTVEALMHTVAEVLGVHASTVPVPQSVLRVLGTAADVASNVSGRKLPLNRKLARQLLAPGWTCSIEKAKAKLGYRPTRTVREALERSAKSYLELGWL